MAGEAMTTVTDDTAAGCMDGPLRVGDMTLASRLIVGTGKYATHPEMARCLAAAGADCEIWLAESLKKMNSPVVA